MLPLPCSKSSNYFPFHSMITQNSQYKLYMVHGTIPYHFLFYFLLFSPHHHSSSRPHCPLTPRFSRTKVTHVNLRFCTLNCLLGISLRIFDIHLQLTYPKLFFSVFPISLRVNTSLKLLMITFPKILLCNSFIYPIQINKCISLFYQNIQNTYLSNKILTNYYLFLGYL